ncbi:MAG: AbrB/MazE/SpoVT family DNA-binding domain-containing protein [Parvularculaceae bacterium]
MTKTLKICQIGNSLGVVLPKSVLTKLALNKGDDLALEETEGGLILRGTDTDHAEAQKWLDIGADKYRRTLNILSK